MIERYRREIVQKIFTDESKFDAYLKMEIHTLEAWSNLGKIPKSDVDKIREKATFSVERIKEIETECANFKFTFGAFDDLENPVPTGMACEGITTTATFNFLWEFCEKNCPEVNKLALWKSSCNFFAPNENALYHDDDDSPGAMTLIYYANK